MADRRGRSRTRSKSKYNVNDPRNWTKAKLRSKLQDLGIRTPPKFSRTVLVDLYLKQHESSRPALSEQTTVTTETESSPTADGAHGTLTHTEHPVLMAHDSAARSFMDGMKTESTPPQRRNRKRHIAATATTTRPVPSLFNRMHPVVKTAKYTDDSATDFPTVKILEKNYTAVIGEQVQLECSLSGTPQITAVSWQRILPEGQTVTLDIDEIKYTGSKLNDPHLVINDIKKTDEGDYMFTISSVSGERKSARTKLKVNGGPPTLNMKPKRHYKTEGDTAILKCNVIAEPPATNLTWTKNEGGSEHPIAIDNDKYHGGLLKSPSLIIAETEKCYDEGKYTCEAENHAGQGSNSVHLTIENKYKNTETDETTHNEGITEHISFRHVQMVNTLSDIINPKAKYWTQFIAFAKVYVPNSERRENLHEIISYLMQMELISYGKYTKLFQIVNEIDKEAARIIKKAEADIERIKNGGRITETTAELECMFNGNYNPNLPQTCTCQTKEQYRDVDGRIKGSGREGSIVLKFTISEAQTPLQPSALYLAVTLKTRLENRKIVLKDESNEPLVLQTTPKVTIPTDNPKDIPTIRLSRGHYRFTEGKDVILKCVVIATVDTESIQWFRVKDGNSHAICIDNKKYFGGLSNSPSLAIADVKKSDRGLYFCKAKNSAGEVESDKAFVEIKSIGDLDTRTADGRAEKRSVFTAKESASTLKHEVKKKLSSLMVDTGCVMEDPDGVMKDTGGVMEDTGGVMEDTGGVMEDTVGVKEDTGGVMEDTGGVMEDTSGLMKDTSDVKNLGTLKVDVVKEELSSGLEGNASIKDNDSALEEDDSSMKKDTNVIKQERHVVSAVKTDSFTDQDSKTSMIDPYKTNTEKRLKYAKLVTKLTEYVSPKLDTWPTFRESLCWALPPPYGGENLDSIVNHLIKKQIIQFGQYQKLYDVVDQIDRKASIIIKKAEAKEDCSDGEDDISSIKKDIGSMKMDILAIKQDVAIISQIVGTVKTESTTDQEHETSNRVEQTLSYETYIRLFTGITERYHCIRVVFTGKSGAGKTTLCCRIRNEYVDLVLRLPTLGAVLHPASFFIDWSSKIWKTYVGQSLTDVMTTRIAALVANMETSANEAGVQTGSQDQPGRESLATSSAATSEPISKVLKEAVKVRDASRRAQSDDVFLSLWDMGGHTSFRATHNVFISSHGVYLLVFRLPDLLRDKMETDRLKKWIRLIGTFSAGELNAPRLKPHAPPLIFVGTFLDWLKKSTSDYDRLVQKMQSNIAKFPELTAHTFVRFCTADNSLGNDDRKLEVLRGLITEAAVHQDQWDRQIPARWLKLEMDLLKAREDGTRILTFAEVIEMNKESIATLTDEREMKLALEFLHCTRSVVYFREFDHVITDPQWLADFFSILITDDQFLPKGDLLLTRDLDLYTTKGELTDNLTDSLLSLEKNQAFRPYKFLLLALMEKFGLIVKILLTRTTTANAQFSETYIIPSKLMELQNVDEITSAVSILKQRNRAVSKTLCFVFKDVYVPDELFHRVFAEIMRRYRAVSLSTSSFDGAAERDQATVANTVCLYLGFGCFEVDGLSRVIVSMHAERSAMAVTLISPTESNLPADSGPRLRFAIEKILRETLKISNQLHFSYVHQLHCNFHLSPYDTPVQLYGVINSEKGVLCKGSECEGQHTLSRTDTKFWNITKDSARFQGTRDIAGTAEIRQNTSDRRPSPRELGRLSRLINSSRLELFFLELGLPDLEIEDTKRESYNMPRFTLVTKLFLKWTIAYPNKTINDIQQTMEAVGMATDRIDDVLGMNDESVVKDMVTFEVWNRVLSEDEIRKVVDNIDKMYFNLCLELGLSPPTIEQCELCHSIDFITKISALLQCWIDRFKTKATIGRLLSAMKVCQMDWRTTAQIWSPSKS